METTPLTREALTLITDELEQLGSQVGIIAPKVQAIGETLERIERLLVQELRGHAQAEDQAQRKQVATNERFERIERALKLRPANGI